MLWFSIRTHPPPQNVTLIKFLQLILPQDPNQYVFIINKKCIKLF